MTLVSSATRWTLDAVAFAIDSGLHPDAQQSTVLRDPATQIEITASRQWGKSSIVSRLALRVGVLKSNSLVLIGSIGERQAQEMLRKVRDGLMVLGQAGIAPSVVRESMTIIELSNRSRIVSLPGDERAWRSWSAPDLVIIDESARVPDDVFESARPLLSSGRGRMVLLTSAWATTGFHFRTLTDPTWSHYRIPASQCPRFSPEWLASERVTLGARKYAREFECEWGSASEQLFEREVLLASLDPAVRPLFPTARSAIAQTTLKLEVA